MKKIIITLLCVVTYYVSKAQPSFTVSDKEDAKAVAHSILAVVVKEADEKFVKRLSKKPEDLKAYKESIAEINRLLNEIVPQEWHFSKEVKFISKAEAEKLKDEKDHGYCLLSLTEVSNYKMGDFYSPNEKYGFNGPRDMAYHMSSGGNALALSIVKAWRPSDEFVLSFVPAVGISRGSVVFMVRNLENQLRDCLEKDVTKFGELRDQIEKKRPALKSKTLLLFDPLISKPLKKVIDAHELSKYYDFKYEVVSFEKADEIIASKNPEYAYIWVIPAGAVSQGKVLFNYFIIDAEDSRPMFLTGTAVVGSNGDFHQYHFQKVNKKLD